jgi:hypothetical protein
VKFVTQVRVRSQVRPKLSFLMCPCGHNGSKEALLSSYRRATTPDRSLPDIYASSPGINQVLFHQAIVTLLTYAILTASLILKGCILLCV